MKTAGGHVALVLPVLHPGGAERVAAELAARLPAHGFATSVICLEDESAPVGAEIADRGIAATGLRKSRFRTLACARALAARLPADRPLIVHSHLHHANLAARLALRHLPNERRQAVHLISTVHIVERRFRPWQFRLDRLTAHLADCEVCVSAAVARYQQARTKLPAGFFRVIENGIDLTRYTPAERPDPSTSGATAATDSPHVVSTGRLNPQKDFETLLRAWSAIEARFPTARLTIAGEGPHRRRLEQLVQQLRLRSVSLPGFVTDVPALLRQADLYAQSSLWEGQPLSVIEAMATHLPIVVTDGDGLPETIAHDQTGLVVPRGNPEALGTAILQLLTDPGRAAKLAGEAYEEAHRRFSIDRMVSDYASLYWSLINMSEPPAVTLRH